MRAEPTVGSGASVEGSSGEGTCGGDRWSYAWSGGRRRHMLALFYSILGFPFMGLRVKQFLLGKSIL
jgi:hypothetical protein